MEILLRSRAAGGLIRMLATVRNHRCRAPARLVAVLVSASAIGAAVVTAPLPATAAPNAPAQGIDVSSWQGSSINWGAVASYGISFAYIRAAEGAASPDADFQTNWFGALGAGITPGAYLYFHPGDDPAAQARLFSQELQSVSFVRGDLLPVIDVETTDNLPASTVVANLQALVAAVASAIGELPAIYTSPVWWDDYVGSSSFVADPLWVANWGVSSPSLPASNWGGFGWQAWQYTSSGSVPGIAGRVDMDEGGPAPPSYHGSAALQGTHFAAVDTAGNGSSAITVTDDRIYVRPSTKSAFGTTQTWSTTPFFGTRGTLFADLDGHGKPDSAVAINDSDIFVMDNANGSFGPPQVWSNVPFYGTRATLLADVDGSGRASAVAINDTSIWVMLNQGSGFGPPQLWSNRAFFGDRGTSIAMVDGSGRASPVAINDSTIWVLPNLGGSFGPPVQWASSTFFGTRSTVLADLDGSGRASVVAMDDSSIWVEANTGKGGFASPALWANQPFAGTWEYLADVDGSGRASAVAVTSSAIWVAPNTGGAFGTPTLWLAGAFYGTH